jgi:DNA-dependent RNA polymerase auxiliary subunit epsilon
MYAFQYEAYDRSKQEDRNRENVVDVTVTAETEADATAKVEGLVAREVYKLENVTELSKDFHAISNRW